VLPADLRVSAVKTARRAASPFALVILLGPLACAGSAASKPESATASDATNVIDSMTSLYASCKTYEDRGKLVLTRRYNGTSDFFQSTISFETVFDRAAGRFRFEFTETRSQKMMRGAIWRTQPGLAHEWWTHGGAVQDVDLVEAVRALAGVSLGTSYHVPGMLFGIRETLLTRRFQEAAFRRSGEETLGGSRLTVLSVERPDASIRALIDVHNGALRKIVEWYRDDLLSRPVEETPGMTDEERNAITASRKQSRPFTTEVVTEYDAAFDKPIDPGRFEFVPPADQPGRTPAP
jgi:hypothetical protein